MAQLSTRRASLTPLGLIALFVCLASLAAPTFAHPPETAPIPTAEALTAEGPTVEEATAHSDDIAVDVSGVTVFVDPETGRLRQPNPQQAQELAQALRQRFTEMDKTIASPKFERRADGTAVYRAAPEFMSYTVGLATPDGQTATTCAPSLERATDVLENAETFLQSLEQESNTRPQPEDK